MDDKQSGVTLWQKHLDVVDAGKRASEDAAACVSCGNTGALMAMSIIRRLIPGVVRPANAVLWPARSAGFNIMLDVGADIRADAKIFGNMH